MGSPHGGPGGVGPGRGVPGAAVHHLPRLLPRLLLSISSREPDRGLHHGAAHVDAFRPVAAVPQRASRDRRRSGQNAC